MSDGPVPVSDLDIADRIVRAAKTGPPGDREPTVAQLLAAFDEPQATPEARRRVAAALEMAGAAVSPGLLDTPATERVRITPPGGGGRQWSSAQRLGAGAAVIAGIIALVTVISGHTGKGQTADKGLPAGTTATRPTTTARTTPRTTPASGRGVSVRVNAADPSFVCVDNGRGKVLYRGTLTGTRTFTGHHIRVNIAKDTVVLQVDGRRIRLAQSPTGYDINLHHVIHLPAAGRPCPTG
jgi:hypothetical protein